MADALKKQCLMVLKPHKTFNPCFRATGIVYNPNDRSFDVGCPRPSPPLGLLPVPCARHAVQTHEGAVGQTALVLRPQVEVSAFPFSFIAR